MGLVRREIAWFSIYEPWFQMAMIGAWLAALSVVAFATNILMTWRYGEPIIPNITPRWVVSGLALEEQSRINEGTYNPNLIYSRIPYPKGLQKISPEEESPVEIISPIRVGQTFYGKVLTSFKSFLGIENSSNLLPLEKKSDQL